MLDPFLLWKSPSQQDNTLHAQIINSFESAWHSDCFLSGRKDEAVAPGKFWSATKLVWAIRCHEGA